jgi:branched-subunit amino acid transport protein
MLSAAASMWLWRLVPFFALRGRTMSARTQELLGLIPPAAFAALVANDLVQPSVWATDPATTIAQLLAAAGVALVAARTKNLMLCALFGVVLYALLLAATTLI